jgi:hypothetical protein
MILSRAIVFIGLFAGIAFAAPEPAPQSARQIPGMEFLLAKLAQFPVRESTRQTLDRMIRPTPQRVYYRGDPSFLSPEEYQAILKKYSEIFHIPAEKVLIFAVTNFELKRTMLFPEFYKLPSEASRAASLLHESLWLWTLPLSYENVVAVENAARAYFQHPEDSETFFNFFYLMSEVISPRDLLLATWSFDESHAPGPITVGDFLGDEFLECYFASSGVTLSCQSYLQQHLSKNAQNRLFSRAVNTMFLAPDITLTARQELKTKESLKNFSQAVTISFQFDQKTDPPILLLIEKNQIVGKIELH